MSKTKSLAQGSWLRLCFSAEQSSAPPYRGMTSESRHVSLVVSIIRVWSVQVRSQYIRCRCKILLLVRLVRRLWALRLKIEESAHGFKVCLSCDSLDIPGLII